MPSRDTSRDGLGNKIEAYVLTHFEPLWRLLNQTTTVGNIVNAILINRAVKKTGSRPFPFSTLADYTSWRSLTDRSWFARHLPPKRQEDLPPVEEAVNLFKRRSNEGTPSDKSTFLFASFAEWFTDGFLLTDAYNAAKTSSSHQIDLNPLYGVEEAVTRQLRLLSNEHGKRGRLKSETDQHDEEFAPLLFNNDE
jgi:prostaglandin-endoperoxide synthase 2